MGDLDHFFSHLGISNRLPMNRLKYLYHSNSNTKDERFLLWALQSDNAEQLHIRLPVNSLCIALL